MTRNGFVVYLIAVAASLTVLDRSLPAKAHPPAILNQAGEKAIAEEIIAFRKTMADVIRAKDRTKLRDMYAASFVHVHTSTKTDDRDARMTAALAGDAQIETAEISELNIRSPNDWTAIVSGTSPLNNRTVRWLAVYVRTQSSWALATSQATSGQD